MVDPSFTPTIAAGIEAMQEGWPGAISPSRESPVFVLSAGWRSGSTLLQRLLMRRCFLWGEPYGHAGLIDSLAAPLRCFNRHWPEPHHIYRGQEPAALSREFIGNLYPPPERLFDAHLQFFQSMFIDPARQAGAANWGLKTVRLTADHAYYLRWLFPRAKFLFLHRNPYDAYRSYAARRNAGWSWYYAWPDQPLTVQRFGRHWRELTQGFCEHCERLEGLVVRYEDLQRKEFAPVERYLEMELDREAAEINPDDGGPPPLAAISAEEFAVLDREVGELAGRLGYRTERPAAQRPPSVAAVNGNLDPAKCVILVPVGGQIEPECEDSLRKLEARGYQVRRVRGYAAIDQARNQMATDAVSDGFEELLWIDSDVAFQPDDVERLRSHSLPIVCGIYPKKGQRALSCHVAPGTKELLFGVGGGLTELLYAATGFLLVRREVFVDLKRELELPICNERFGRPLVPYFMPLLQPEKEGCWYLAEDYAFSQRTRQCGYRIWADTTIRLKHIGTYAFSWEDSGGELQRFATYKLRLPAGESPTSQEVDAGGEAAGEAPDAEFAQKLARLSAAHPWPSERPAILPNERHGWLSESTRDLLKAALNRQTRLVVELGSWLGLSTRFIAHGAPRATVIAVDHWRGSDEHQGKPEFARLLPVLYETFLSSCWRFRDRIIPLRMTTAEGLQEIARLGLRPDVVYLDADSSYEEVNANLKQIRRLFPGAVLIADDWDWETVRRGAIDAAAELGELIGVHGTAFRFFANHSEMTASPPLKQGTEASRR